MASSNEIQTGEVDQNDTSKSVKSFSRIPNYLGLVPQEKIISIYKQKVIGKKFNPFPTELRE